jgi:hypothetical protein
MKTAFASLLIGIFGIAPTQAEVPEKLKQESLEHLAGRAGVSPFRLESFFKTLQETTLQPRDSNEYPSVVSCSTALNSNFEARNQYLECLEHSALVFDAESFAELMQFRARYGSKGSAIELEKTLALIAFLEDLARSQKVARGEPASWFSKDEGFLQGSGYLDYEFQDGDIVLGLGNSSLSSLISQITDPKSRYSHAFLIKKGPDGKISTIESLVETGVKEFPQSHLLSDHYNQLTVLRWKDPATRSVVTARAMAFAQKAADRRLKYDSEIDLDDDKRMFCTELVAKAYVEGAGVRMDEILPSLARITNDRVFRFVSKLGVSNRDVVSPGDLMNSPHFEIVADWRRSGDLFRSWELYLMGDLLLGRIANGWTLKSDPALFLMPLPILMLQTLPGLLHSDLRLLPESIGAGGFAMIGTTELHIYRPAIRLANRVLERNLLQSSPWELRASLEHGLNTNRASRTYLKPPRR